MATDHQKRRLRTMADSTTLPKVTVVVPTHARPELLRILLDSMTKLTYLASQLEVIVVHNKTDDRVESVVNECARTAPFPIRYFRVIYDGRNPNPSRKLGVSKATGSIIAFTDDDCVVTPEWVTSGVACFRPGIGIVQGRTLPNLDQPRRLLEHTIEITEETGFYETCNIFYRKEALEEKGAFADDPIYFGEDTVLGLNVKERGYALTFCEEALVYHEVVPITFMQWLLKPGIGLHGMSALPKLIRQVPALRERMFLRYFLHARTALFDLLLLGLLLSALLHPLCLLLALPYIIYRYCEPYRVKNPLVRIARILFGTPRAFVLFAALAIGSIRHRTLIL